MKSWQEDLLRATEGVRREHAVVRTIQVGARSLAFKHCALGTACCAAVLRSEDHRPETLGSVMGGGGGYLPRTPRPCLVF